MLLVTTDGLTHTVTLSEPERLALVTALVALTATGCQPLDRHHWKHWTELLKQMKTLEAPCSD